MAPLVGGRIAPEYELDIGFSEKENPIFQRALKVGIEFVFDLEVQETKASGPGMDTSNLPKLN